MAAFPRIGAMGVTGVLVSFSDRLSDPANRAALAFHARVAEVDLPGVLEIAVTLASVYLRIDPTRTDAARLSAVLERLLAERDWARAELPGGRKRWIVPTAFGGDEGPQLGEAAALAGLSEEAAVNAVTSQPLRVLALGFAPGQPYLGILPPVWDIPRQTDLTPRVPIGAVVVAVRQIVLFGTSAPTGWRQMGWCGFECYKAGREAPIALRPGDEVRFREAPAAEVKASAAADATGTGGALVEVL